MQQKVNELGIFDFDNTITKEHTFAKYGLTTPQTDATQYEYGKHHAKSNIKTNIPMKHSDDELSAVATFHNNPHFIAGYISIILGKELTFRERRAFSKEVHVAVNIYTVEGINRPFLIAYVPQYGHNFDEAITALSGKNKHIELIRRVLFEYLHISFKNTTVNFYDDSKKNLDLARNLSNVNCFLVDPKAHKFSRRLIHNKSTTDVALNAKIESIRCLCLEYQRYLKENTQWYPHDDEVLRQKKQSMVELCEILKKDPNDPETLIEFKQAFERHKAIIAQRRDTTSIFFIKAVLTILTLGLASLCGLWKIKGQTLQTEVDDLILSEEPIWLNSTV